MKILFSVLALALGSHSAFAADITGRYYIPFYQAPGETEFQPEELRIFNADGTYEFRTIHLGFQLVYRGTYSTNGSEVTFNTGEYPADCKNLIEWSTMPTFTANFSKSDSALSLSAEGESFSIAVATEEQAQKVLTVPLCGK